MSEDFYKAAREGDYAFFGRALTDDLRERMKQEWIDFLEGSRALTEERYRALPTDEKEKYRRAMRVRGTRGYVRAATNGEVFDFWDALKARYKEIAMLNAIQARKAAGWQDDGSGKYKITPTGRTTTYNGRPLGDLVMPEEVYDFGGVWSDVLGPGERYTV